MPELTHKDKVLMYALLDRMMDGVDLILAKKKGQNVSDDLFADLYGVMLKYGLVEEPEED